MHSVKFYDGTRIRSVILNFCHEKAVKQIHNISYENCEHKHQNEVNIKRWIMGWKVAGSIPGTGKVFTGEISVIYSNPLVLQCMREMNDLNGPNLHE